MAAPDSGINGDPPGPAIETDAVPLPIHDTVTTACVDVDFTLKLKDDGADTVTVNVVV